MSQEGLFTVGAVLLQIVTAEEQASLGTALETFPGIVSAKEAMSAQRGWGGV